MAKLKGPVGGGKKAQNDPKDVAYVQHLLAGHAETVGFKAPRASGKIDQTTITAIGHFQNDVVKTRVTSLVEPGSKTLKMLQMAPRAAAKKSGNDVPKTEDGKPVKGKIYTVKWRGKTHHFTEENFMEFEYAISCRLHTEVMRFMDTLRNYQATQRELKAGVTAFFVQMVTPDAELERPEKSLKAASAAISKLVSMAYGKNRRSLLAAFKQMTQTKILLDAAAFDINILAKELGNSAKVCEEIAVDLRDGAADIVQLILVTNGVNPATAGAVVAASKNTVQEIANGVILKGQWVKAGGAGGALTRVTFATIGGGVSGWVGGKIGKAVMAGVGDRIAAAMVRSGWFQNTLRKIATRYCGRVLGKLTVKFSEKIAADLVVVSLVRAAHKWITGPVIAKWIVNRLNLIDKILVEEVERATSQKQLVAAVATRIEKSGIAATMVEDLLKSHEKEILADAEKEIMKANAKAA